MRDRRFDEIARWLAGGVSRRAALRGFIGAGLAAAGSGVGGREAGAQRLCLWPGERCRSDRNCCEGRCLRGICRCPKRSTRCEYGCCPPGSTCEPFGICRAVGGEQGVCPDNLDSCRRTPVLCRNSCYCYRRAENATSFCGVPEDRDYSVNCERDTDCDPGQACIVTTGARGFRCDPGQTGRTACANPCPAPQP